MGSFAAEMTIRAPVEEVFKYRLDLLNLPDYNPDVLAVEPTSQAGPGLDSAYRLRVRLAPWLTIKAHLTVSVVERPRRLEFEVNSIMKAREVCMFTQVGDHTHVRFETRVQTPGGPLAGVIDRFFVLPNTRRQITKELELMKLRLESQRLRVVQ